MNPRILCLLVPFLAACSAVGYYHRNPRTGAETALLLPSFLGEQHIEHLSLDGPGGVHVAIDGYHTHNPDREFTKAAKGAYITNQITGLAKTGVNRLYDNKDITAKANGQSLVKGTKDPNVIPQDPNVIPVNPNQ